MVEAAEVTADAQIAHRAVDRVAASLGRLAGVAFELERGQERHEALLAELSAELDDWLTPEPQPANLAA